MFRRRSKHMLSVSDLAEKVLKAGVRLLKDDKDELLLLHTQDAMAAVPADTHLQHEYDIKLQGMKVYC